MAKFKLKKVEQVRVFEQAVLQIRELILSGEFAAGDKLPSEQELCDELNISRSSIREALRVLEAEGIIEVRRGSGVYVAENPLQNTIRSEYIQWLANQEESLLQLMEVRGSIEGLTASLAACAPTEETIEKLSAIVAEQVSLLDSYEDDEQDKVSRLAKLDEEFHLVISQASHNSVAHEIIAHIIPAYNQVNKAVIYIGGRPRQMVKEHKAILSAIKANDPKGAENAMRKHIARVRSEIISPGSELQDPCGNQIDAEEVTNE
jgi:GntR family transcriptional repressor for pyruvate dehydrogenase complex